MANIDYQRTLGETVQAARVRADLSLRDLAKIIAVSPSYLSDIENDRRTPSEEVLKELAKQLQIDFDNAMALAGRFGEKADRYLKRQPMAGVLFRKLSDVNASNEVLNKLINEVKGKDNHGDGRGAK